MNCLSEECLKRMRDCSRFVAELANQVPARQQPYVGESAFAHKGGIHVSAVLRNPRTYEHIPPEAVGNKRRIIISDLSGRATIEEKAKEYDLDFQGKNQKMEEILKNLKNLENQGYCFEGAEGSFELLMRESLEEKPIFFQLVGFRVLDEKKEEGVPPYSEATIMINVDGKIEHTAAEGSGPVNALDNALRKALEKFYPKLKELRLLDYKVRVLPAGEGTASHVRVLVESGDGKRKWGTVGVSYNIIEASWQALVDSIDYKLQMDAKS
jgi:2-isopropylmalate synthase